MKGLIQTIVMSVFPVVAAMAATPESPIVNAVPDAGGLLRTTVNVVAPSVDVDGNPLASLDKVEVYRDLQLVKIFDVIAPCEERSFDDIPEGNGYLSYMAVAYSDNTPSSNSMPNRIFVGVDVPLAPKNFKAAVSDNKITFTWSKVANKGELGETVLPDRVTYVVESLDDSYNTLKTLSESKTRSFAYYCPINEGVQDIMRFGLRATNTSGWSSYAYVRVVSGAPYNFPVRESFAAGVFKSLMWQEGDGAFGIIAEDSSDDDRCALYCVPSLDGNTTSFNMGKISMKNTLNPRLTFKLKGLEEGNTVVVKVARADGAEAALLTINEASEDWKTYTIDLAGLKRENYIIPKFVLGDKNYAPFLLDDIRFEDPYPDDLGVFVKAPEFGYGDTEVEIVVTNEGTQKAAPVGVEVFTDGVLTSQIPMTRELAPGESEILKATVNIVGTESVEVRAKVWWIYDVNPANDIASAQIIPDKPQNSTPTADVTSVDDVRNIKSIFTVEGVSIAVPENLNQLPAGLYIIDGKKTIIRN